MPIDSGKKLTILRILSILKKYTDEDHPMTQQQIQEKLRSEFGMAVDRGTVKNNVMDLIDTGYLTGYRVITRSFTDKATGEKEESEIYTDLYYEHEFTESELHMLIDGLLFSRSVPYSALKEMIRKLGELSSSYFSQRMQYGRSMNIDSPQNKDLFWNIEVLDEAIAEGKQVEIVYGHYGTDLMLHATLNEDGTEKKQVLNPYQMVASEGRYYLICNKDNKDAAANYRIDRIMDIAKLDTPVKPKDRVKGLEDGLKLQDYVYQHVNMFSGELENIEFTVPAKSVSLVVDFFGENVRFFDKGDGTVSCRVTASREGMKKWAAQFAATVRVEAPAGLVEEIREEIRKAAANYGM